MTVHPHVFDVDDEKNYHPSSDGEKFGTLARADYYSVVSQSSVLKQESMMPLFRCILDLEAVILDQSKTMCEEFGRVLCVNRALPS